MCFKADLRKAYDSINRVFLLNVMKRMGFSQRWCLCIKECLNASFAVLVNGMRSEMFGSSNGVRQGDPIAPDLFIVCMQVLSCMLKEACAEGTLKPMSQGGVEVSHIFFADDLLIFAEADPHSCAAVKQVLGSLFERAINECYEKRSLCGRKMQEQAGGGVVPGG
jgi:hypothetical protein